MIREGEGRYTWKKRNQSLSYVFKEEIEKVLANSSLDSIFAKSEWSSHQYLKNIWLVISQLKHL